MPHATPFTKVSRTEVLGARVIVEGEGFHDARAHALTLAADTGATFVPAFDDPHVIAGQGTVALEILEQAPEVDTVVVPVGGGGLIAGCAIAVRARRPNVRVIGVQVDTYAGMAHALGRTATPTGGMTIAEGIAVVEPGALTVAIARELVDDIVVVTEDDIERAVGLYLDIEKVVVEGAGAASLAALLACPEVFADRNCVLVASGANIDPRMLSSVLLRSLAAQRPARAAAHGSARSTGRARHRRLAHRRGRRQHRRRRPSSRPTRCATRAKPCSKYRWRPATPSMRPASAATSTPTGSPQPTRDTRFIVDSVQAAAHGLRSAPHTAEGVGNT